MRRPAIWLRTTKIILGKHAIELYTIQDICHEFWLSEAWFCALLAAFPSVKYWRAAAFPAASTSFSRRLSTASRAAYT